MSNIWNFQDPLRCGFVKLATAGREKYGTVIKSGFMRKTVTVRVDNTHEVVTYRSHLTTSGKFQVHDEDEICRTGDKVVIKACHPISKLKHYYLRNIIWMGPRQNFTINKFLAYEKRAVLYNEMLRNEHSADIVSFKEGGNENI